ncbi:eukaryotic aspartyl protease [Xylaria telfairii]|nr:eukaryotic aspartyl protease [Xylaria telfairii]
MDAIYSAQNEFKKGHGLTKVRAVHNQNYRRNGIKSYVHLLRKYNFEPTKAGPYFRINRPKQKGLLVSEKFKAALGGRVTQERVLVKKESAEPGAKHDEVTAEDSQNDTLYLCKVAVGTPPQNLMLDFDTGSADFWVFSKSLNSSQEKDHNKIEYGDGSYASGDCGTDTLTIGGLSVKKQTVEIAKKLSDQFVSNTGDGLLGLAFSKINTVHDGDKANPQATPVENMIKQDDIPKEAALFTSAFYSSRDAATSKSFYTFGFIDEELVKQSGEEIHWVDIDNTDGLWAFPSESVSINGELTTRDSNIAIADTGTTLALMSDDVVDALYSQIPGATYDWANQGYIFPKDVTVDDLPDFKVAVGGREFLIQKEDLAFAPTDDGEGWYGGVQSRGILHFDILGDTFLKSVYTIWDQGNTRFGVVPKIEGTQNLTPPTATGEEIGEEKTKVTSVAMAAADLIDPISVPL